MSRNGTTSDDEEAEQEEFHDATEELPSYSLTESQPEPEPEPEPEPDDVQKILNGTELVVSHVGASQYARGGAGVSACGLAAFNCARVILGMERRGLRDESLLREVMSRATVEEITSICSLWSSNVHLEVEDIYQVPIFNKTLALESTEYARPSLREFTRLLSQIKSSSNKNASVAVIITRPPEIIACFKIVTAKADVFMIFDSHPRPNHPDGSGFIFNTSIDAIAAHLDQLLAVDDQLVDDSEMQWQTQLLANYSGHIFVSRGASNDPVDLTTALLESSLTILELQAELSSYKAQVDSLKSNHTNLETELERKERRHLDDKRHQTIRTNSLVAENQRLRTTLAEGDRRNRNGKGRQHSRGAEHEYWPPLTDDSNDYIFGWGDSATQSRTRDSRALQGVPGPSRPTIVDQDNRAFSQQTLPAYTSGTFEPDPRNSHRSFADSGPRQSAQADYDFELAARLQSEWEECDRRDAAANAAGKRQDKALGISMPWNRVKRNERGSATQQSSGSTSSYAAALLNQGTGDETQLTVKGSGVQSKKKGSNADIKNTARPNLHVRNPPQTSQSSETTVRLLPKQDDAEEDFMLAAKMQIESENSGFQDEKTAAKQQTSGFETSVRLRPKRDKAEEDFMLAAKMQIELENSRFQDAEMAAQQQSEFLEEDQRLRAERDAYAKPHFEHQTLEAVAELRRKYEEEDRRLEAERRYLADMAQPVFKCGVCLEEHPLDSVACVDGCEHQFCRDCMRSYIVSKLDEHRFPILCPVCSADGGVGDPGMISEALVQQVSIPEKHYATFTELQLVGFSIMLDCRKCKRSAFVDREEYEAAPILSCPLPDCTHMWCKTCQQEVQAAGPTHSCDGTTELDHLMKSEGWKHCPGCRTPIQKSYGCNHMTCVSPGCNSHFCYTCGELIVRSASAREVSTANAAHFTRCQLFEVPAEQVA